MMNHVILVDKFTTILLMATITYSMFLLSETAVTQFCKHPYDK